MANFKDTVNVPTAISDNTAMDLSSKHITTANWMQLNPIYWKEMVPGEKLEVNVESFTRLNPLVVPTFAPGSKLKVSRFFVPFRTIFRGWNDFITDAYHTPSNGGDGKDSGLIYKVPTFTNDTLLDAFVTPFTNYSTPFGSVYAVSAASATSTTQTPEDLGVDFVTNGGIGYNFTPIGRQALKVIQSLGYKLNPNYGDTQEYSALPLLAYAKVYADYYWPSAYMNSYAHYYLESLFNTDNGSNLQLTATQIALLLRFCTYVCYDSDYFVSAFDTPTAPSVGNFSEIKLNDYSLPSPFIHAIGSLIGSTANSHSYVSNFNNPISSGQTGVTSSQGTPAIYSDSGYYPQFTQYVDSMLHRLTDYMKRHQLAGSRAMERYLARFGKSLSAEKLNRSVYLGTDVTTIQIGDVMSTSDTLQTVASSAKANDTGSTTGTTVIGSQLGAYAGKGIAYGKNDYDGFSTDEYGIYIITASLVPDVFYDQGIDANVLHIYKSEFWTPEFDYGMRSLTADELIITNNGQSPYASGSIHNQVFGFTPRYSEYRFGRSRLTGSFRVPTLNGNSEFGSNAWHMMRTFDDRSFPGTGGTASITSCVHSPSFVYGVRDAGQYNRMFFNDDFDAPDQFVMIYSFDVKSYSPMPSLYENYEWCDEQSGRNIAMQTNGVKVN